jgi:prevent-host-death family protein
MRHVVNTYEAKTQLSKLIELTLQGDEVIIANRGQELVTLVPVAPRKKVVLGLYQGVWPAWDPDSIDLTEDFKSDF